jgi:hypothetical protein
MLERRWGLAIVLFLTACAGKPAITAIPTMPVATLTSPPETHPTAAITTTQSPQPTPTSAIPIPPGFVSTENMRVGNFVFLIDPAVWTMDTPENPEYLDSFKFLHHNTIQGCRLDVTIPRGMGTPERFYVKRIGSIYWSVYDNTSTAVYEAQYASLYMTLSKANLPDCRTAQEKVLERMVASREFHGGPTSTPLREPTPPAPLDDFHCASLTPLLRPANPAYIIADGIWLRNDPHRTEETKSRLLQKYAPYHVLVDGSPVCDNDYVFWHVTVYQIGEGGETMTGWMAEANSSEYFLETIYH